MYVVPIHSRFRGSVNYGALSMENSFQVANFLFKVQNGPGVIWVACIGLSERSKCSLRFASAFLGAFWTVSNTWGCAHEVPKNIMEYGCEKNPAYWRH